MGCMHSLVSARAGLLKKSAWYDCLQLGASEDFIHAGQDGL